MGKIYDECLSLVKEIYCLQSTHALLGWDQETMMPPRGGKNRSEMSAAISKVIQKKFCSDKLGDALEGAAGEDGLTADEKAIIREVKKDREKLIKIPFSLTEEIARTTSIAQQKWAVARKEEDKPAFNPWLKKVVNLLKQKAQCLGFEREPYDALLDQFEPAANGSEVEKMLIELKSHITPLLHRISASSVKPDGNVLNQNFPVPIQKNFNKMVLRDMTFNLDAGRFDESVHPFTEGIGPGDARITTRYSERELQGALSGTIHEVGHGLYEQGFLPKFYNTPLAESVSLGIHESQSRLWENMIARSLPFWRRYFPMIQTHYMQQFAGVSLEQFYLAYNAVSPSFIRVDADEVTYNLHIIIRFELERALFNEELKVDDIDEAWNLKTKQLLGIAPATPSEGYLQDVHWSVGLIGYFPTYSLGNIYSAQLYAKAVEELPDLERDIIKGNFHPLREWLRLKIHQHGRRYSPATLIEKATGRPPSANFFIDYLEAKYGALYNL